MNEPRLFDMSEAEFEALIEGHIEQMATSDHELPANVFVDLLFERSAAHAKRHIAGSPTKNAVYTSRCRNCSGRHTRRSQ